MESSSRVLRQKHLFSWLRKNWQSHLVLVLPDFTQQFKLHCDASKVGIGGVLSQANPPIATSAKNYLALGLDIVLMMWSYIQLSRWFGIGVITCSRKSLFYILTMMPLNTLILKDKVFAQHASWITYWQQFTFVINQKADALNKVADALVRGQTLLTKLRVEVPGFNTINDLYATDP